MASTVIWVDGTRSVRVQWNKSAPWTVHWSEDGVERVSYHATCDRALRAGRRRAAHFFPVQFQPTW